MYGIGLPTATRLRRYQYPPAASIGIPNANVARNLVWRAAITITATVNAATGARNESLTPAANPAAIPATASAAGAIARPVTSVAGGRSCGPGRPAVAAA